MSDDVANPMGLAGLEFVEFASPAPDALEPLCEKMGLPWSQSVAKGCAPRAGHMENSGGREQASSVSAPRVLTSDCVRVRGRGR